MVIVIYRMSRSTVSVRAHLGNPGLKSLKRASSVACHRLRLRAAAIWQADSDNHIVRSLEQLCADRESIARNPAKGMKQPPFQFG